MSLKIYLTGDINLLNVSDSQHPFQHLKKTLEPADLIFSNLECCFFDTSRPGTISGREGFFVPTKLAEALFDGGISAVGMANNVNYSPKAIRSSIETLEKLGIKHAGAGMNRKEAHRPIIIEHNDLRIGFLQRSSIFWPANHAALEDYPGIAILKAHTAYEPTLPHKPGSPPTVHTWADPAGLAEFKQEISDLKKRCDLVISSHHWGLKETVFDYQIEIAHAAIDAGADVVMGHGAHMPLPIEIYKEKPIFYGLAHLFFLMGHGGKRQTGDGLIAKLTVESKQITKVAFSMVETTDNDLSIPILEADLKMRLANFPTMKNTELNQLEDDALVQFIG